MINENPHFTQNACWGILSVMACSRQLTDFGVIVTWLQMQVQGLNTGRFSLWMWVVLVLIIGAIPLPVPCAGRVLAILIALLTVGLVLVAYGTIRKNKWGINLNPVNCPRCNRTVPQIRQPKSTSQSMWGGWTCETCGCEMDKWGREIQPVR